MNTMCILIIFKYAIMINLNNWETTKMLQLKHKREDQIIGALCGIVLGITYPVVEEVSG